jgi:SAM-dependent methyltransferase
MRIFRQTKIGNWASEVEQVAEILSREDCYNGGIFMGWKLNLGCGHNHMQGFVNVDKSPVSKPDQIVDLEQFPWPWEDNSVDEVMMNHVLEHLGAQTEVYLNVIKELYRVCKPNARIAIRVPHPRHNDFITDPTHVRVVLPEGLQMFSQAFNQECIKNNWANTTLGLYMGVDFQIERSEFVLDDPWRLKYVNGEISPQEMDNAVRNYNNVVKEIHMTLQVIKRQEKNI